MPRKKLYDRKISDVRHEVRLYQVTDSYVKQRAKMENKKQNEIIRELCELARLEELTKGQFSVGTTKVFRSVQDKLLKQNVVDPVENLSEEIRILQKKISEMELNERFMQQEVFKVLKAFFAENQMIVNEIFKEKNRNEVEVVKERNRIVERLDSEFETRKDSFFSKYSELQHLSEQKKSPENSSEKASEMS